jgi:hypothetical protein
MRLLPFLTALPCLVASLAANEVGLDSAGPTRFGARFEEVDGKRIAKFNGDHGLSATFSFAAEGETTVAVQVTLPKDGKAKLAGRFAGKAISGEAQGTGQPQWVELGTAKVAANTPTVLSLEASERKGNVVVHGFRFGANATAVPSVNFRIAYAENKNVSVSDRSGLGAATFRSDGNLLVPVVVEKAGEVTFAARYTLAAGAKRTLQVTLTDNLEAVRTKSIVMPVALAGTGKLTESADFSLSFPKTGTYLIALASQADGEAPFTINGLLIRKGSNANLWTLPNGNAQSVHYGYPIPKDQTALWAYAEAKSAPGPAATYNCVLGFGQGYFGFQRRALGTNPDDRWFIYSLWDNGYVKNNVKKEGADSEELKNSVVRLLAKGDGVTASAFDHEGSGGHSHWEYPWKDNGTYAFLLGVKPDGTGAIFSTYVRVDGGQWKFLTSFRRPNTKAKLDGLYSFVEDWSGSAGQQKRVCQYSNLWIRNTEGKWIQLREAKSSATAELGRSDFDHYVEGNGVVLSTGGYGDPKGKRGVVLQIPESKTPPAVDVDKLPVK